MGAPWAAAARAAPTLPSAAERALVLAEKAMGMDGLQSLQYIASGTGVSVGYAHAPDGNWPALSYLGYALLTDFARSASREESVTVPMQAPAKPGNKEAAPARPREQRSMHFLHEDTAWNMLGPVPLPTPWAVTDRQHSLWTSPHGALWAARRKLESQALRTGAGNSLAFAEDGQFTIELVLGARNTLQEIRSQVAHDVLGDVSVVNLFSDYKLFDGTLFPARLQTRWNGVTVRDFQVSKVQRNPGFAIAPPGLAQASIERVNSEQVADGVWYLTGSQHHSVAIEMKDHVLLVDCPLSDGRAQALAAEIKRLMPGKDIGFVIVTHHHFDTVGGLRGMAARGVDVIAGQNGQSFYERLLLSPRRLQPDAISRGLVRPRVIGVSGKSVLSDGNRRLEIHQLDDSPHTRGLMVVYMPAEKLLIEVDAYTPAPPFAAPPAAPQAQHLHLIAQVQRLKLDVERILPLRGRVVPFDALLREAGKTPADAP